MAKVNLNVDGQEITVYYSTYLLNAEGVCKRCGSKPREVYYFFVQIEEVVNNEGNAYPLSCGVAKAARRRIIAEIKANELRCGLHLSIDEESEEEDLVSSI